MKKRAFDRGSRIWILALCLCIVALPAASQAQSAAGSHFLFPHFVSYPEESTGIAIFNPNSRAAIVTLTLRGLDGKVVALKNNPATVTVPARGQIAKTPADFFSTSANLDGSLEISSSATGLAAYYQTYDPGLTFLDGSDAPADALSLVFPVIPDLLEGLAEIDFVNPNTRDTAVELKLWNFEGNLLGTAVIQVPANGVYRNMAQWIFPAGTRFSGASHITAVSKPRNVLTAAQSVAGTSLFTGFTTYDGPWDWAALNAVPLTQAGNSGVIPYFHTGGTFTSTFALVNVEPTQVNVTVTAIGNNGSTLSTRALTLKAGGGMRVPLQSMMPELGTREQEGWLLVQSSGRTLGGLLYGSSDSGSLTALPLQRSPKAEFVFPQIVQGFGFHADISLVNPTPTTSNVDLQVVGPDGTTLAAAQLAIGPSKRASLSLSQLMPEITELGGGVLHVSATGVLFATTSIWSDLGDIVSNFIPQDTVFHPSPLTSFAATGRVLLNSRPAAGFRVALSGAVNKSTTSDENGTFVFDKLPVGEYTLAIDQFGFQFTPTVASFEITNASRRQDFLGFTASDALLVQPGALPVGSLDTKVLIFGQDFNPTSEAFINSMRLATTFLNSNQLEATIPAYLLGTAANYQVSVLTTGADSTVHRSQEFPFLAYLDRPLLSLITSAGAIVEGGPGGNITLQGAGFLSGAKVKVNGESGGIVTSVVSETEIVAFIPARYFEQGGIYPVTVENVYPAEVESNVQLLAVYYPAPAIEAILPRSVPAKLEAGAGPLNLEVLGYGFRRGSVVWMDNSPLVTTYCETDAYCLSVHLYAKIPAELLRKAGFAIIQVKNPDPSLENLEVATLGINGLQPTITSVLPGTATLADSEFKFRMPIVIEGTNFGSETVARVWKADGEVPDFGSPIELISSTELIVWIDDVEYPGFLGDWLVQVANPAPGGGLSDPVSFFLSKANLVASPFLISLAPQTVAAGGTAFTLTVNGVNFKSGTVVYVGNSPLVTTFVSSKQLRAVVPASLIRSVGRVPVFVTNPDTGGASNRLFLDIR